MSFLLRGVVAGALCLIANSVMAQLSQGGVYFGKIGTGDIVPIPRSSRLLVQSMVSREGAKNAKRNPALVSE